MKYRFLALVVIIVATAPGIASAQTTAPSVLQQWIEAYDGRTADIDDFTIVSDGFTSYHKKYTVDGRSVFKTTTRLTAGGAVLGNMTTTFSADNPHLTAERVGEVAEYAGTADVDGHECHVLRITDSSKLEQDGGFTGTPPKQVEIFIDASLWVVRRITMEAEAEVDGKTRTIRSTFEFEDYRETGGLLYPYSTRVTMDGVDVMEFSPERVERARQALSKMEERMKDMPEAQRDAMQKMIEPQLKRMRQMVEGGRLESVFKVSEILVNTGLSDDLFKNGG